MKYVEELQSEIKKLKRPSVDSQRKFASYMSGNSNSKLNYYGLTVPKTRAILKKDLAVFALPIEKQFEIFEKNWFTTNTFEQMSLSIYWLENLKDDQLVQLGKPALKWAEKIDNWAHSDGLCGVYARIFEKSPKLFMPTYEKWNKHKNPWFRRCSMVGLFYYSRSRKSHPSFQLAKRFIETHFEAPEYYVQKGVGWTIREMYNVYPSETIKLIDNNIHRITSIAWVAASEKLPKKTKDTLLKKRRIVRKKSI